jgi:hypothetical protein
MRTQPRWAAALALLVTAPLAAQDNPAALVVSLQGDVQIQRGGAAAAIVAAVGSRLTAGDRVTPASGSRAVLITRTGASQVVTQATTIAEPAGGGSGDLFSRTLATFAQAATTDARAAGGRQGMIRPIPGEPTLVAPRNELTITATRPSFSWIEVEGSKGYTIQLRAVDGGKPVRYEVTGASWTLPADAPELAAGATYAWTVAPLGGRPAPEQRFEVIGPDARAELDATLASVTDLGLDPAGDGLFLTAVVFRDLDLFYEAAQAIESVEGSGTMTAELYLLKGEILNHLGHAERARAAFDKADALMR